MNKYWKRFYIFLILVGIIGFYYFMPNWTMSLSITDPNEISQHIVVLCFDDGSISQYVNAYPLLIKYNDGATFGIVTGYADKNSSNSMNWLQVKQLYSSGYDIESHTVDHIDLNLIFDSSIIIHELNDSKSDFLRHGIVTNILILPNGDGYFNPKIRYYMSQFYSYARGTLWSYKSAYLPTDLTSPFNRYNIPSISIQNSTRVIDLQNIINNNRIVILVYHRILPVSDSWLTVTTKDFSSQLAYLNSMGIKTMSLGGLFEGV